MCHMYAIMIVWYMTYLHKCERNPRTLIGCESQCCLPPTAQPRRHQATNFDLAGRRSHASRRLGLGPLGEELAGCQVGWGGKLQNAGHKILLKQTNIIRTRIYKMET